MDHFFSPYLSAINEITWQNIDDFSFPSHNVKSWLLEPGSLTQRFQDNCDELTVELFTNQWCEGAELSEAERLLINEPERYLLRQVLLQGDDHPWLIGHSLIPQSIAEEPDANLAELGNKPLGGLLFKTHSVGRDSLQVARLDTPSGLLYARRSRLWVNHSPILVTELFLPFAPIYRYHQENV